MGSQRDNASCLESLESFLEHSLHPLVLEGLISIREQGREIAQQNNGEMSESDVTVQLLKDVKNWTQVLLDEEVRRILQRIPFLQKLLTALFVMKVKVLSVINMRKDTEEFPLTIPANATFLHHVYIQCANNLMDNRGVLDEMNIVDLSPLVKDGIRNACLACVEWADLLSWGLDGVNVNDVISTIMKDEQETDKADDTNAGGDDDARDESGDDDEFADIANESKMTSDGEDGDGDNEDNASTGGDADGEVSGESMFDVSDKNNDDSAGEFGDSTSSNDDGSSVGESVSQSGAAGDADISPRPSESPNPAHQDAKRVSSSSPSFF